MRPDRSAPRALALARHLLAHELRLRWRGLVDFLARKGGNRERRMLLWLGAIIGIAHLVMVPIVQWSGDPPLAAASLSISLAVVFCLLFAAALDTVTYALYARGDYDLLFSSPASPRHIFLVRAFGIFTATAMQIGLYAAPYINVKAVLHGPHWLLAYPVGLALVMFAVAAAVIVSLALVATLGVRRTRIAVQLCAAMTGLSLFLLYRTGGTKGGADDTPLATVFRLPAEAMLGDGVAMAIVLASAALTLIAVSLLLAGPFVATITRAASTVMTQPTATKIKPVRFATTWPWVLVRKEHRLVLRDPWLISQLAMQSLYLLPVAGVLIARIGTEPQAILILPAIVTVFAGQVAGSIAWIALSAEDARELIAVAPVEPRAVVRSKILAVGQLVALAVVPLAALVGYWSPLAGLVSLAGSAAAATAAVLINLWFANTARKHDFMRRRASSSPLVNVLETSILILIGITAALAATASFAAIVGVAIVLALMLVLSCFRPARNVPA